MYRIDNETAVTPIPTPAAPGVNPNYFFTNGDALNGIPATIVDADWANAVQEEICNVIEGAGLTLDKASRTQLLSAIQTSSQQSLSIYAASTSAANTYTATLSPAPASYTTGMICLIKFTNHNTGAATINLNSLGAKSIKNVDGSALLANDINDGMIALLSYDGTNFQLLDRSTTSIVTAIQNSGYIYANDTGSANAVTIALSPAITAYASGQTFIFKAAATNTGNTTINVNSVGLKTIYQQDGSTALNAGDIQSGGFYIITYNGVNFQLLNPRSVPPIRTITAAGLATGGGDLTANRTITVTAATQTDQETATSNTVVVTSGVQQFHPSAAKVYCNKAGASTTINRSYNVSSTTHGATGNHVINFTTSFSDNAYVTVANSLISAQLQFCMVQSQSTGSVSINTYNTGGTLTDPTQLLVACFGDQ